MLPQRSESRMPWDGGNVALLDEPERSTPDARTWLGSPSTSDTFAEVEVGAGFCPSRFELASEDVIDEVRSRMIVQGYRWD